MTLWAVLAAAGRGERFGGPKQWEMLHGKRVAWHAADTLLGHHRVAGLVIVGEPPQPYERQSYEHEKPVVVIEGGPTRAESVINALNHLTRKQPDVTHVAVHDAARPWLSTESLDRVIAAGTEDDHGALLAVPVTDTVKRGDDEGRCETTLDRTNLWLAQTPQVFRLDHLRSAMVHALNNRLPLTDEASAMEAAGYRPKLVQGEPGNRKITTAGDLEDT